MFDNISHFFLMMFDCNYKRRFVANDLKSLAHSICENPKDIKSIKKFKSYLNGNFRFGVCYCLSLIGEEHTCLLFLLPECERHLLSEDPSIRHCASSTFLRCKNDSMFASDSLEKLRSLYPNESSGWIAQKLLDSY
jgi:hypothetical protein